MGFDGLNGLGLGPLGMTDLGLLVFIMHIRRRNRAKHARLPT